MLRKMALTLFAAAVLAAVNVFVPCTPSAAQAASATGTDLSAQQQQGKKGNKGKAAPARKSAPKAAGERRAAPRAARQRQAAPRAARHQRAAPRVTRQRQAAPRVSRQRKATPRVVKQPKTTPRVTRQRKVAPKGTARGASTRKKASAVAAPRVVKPRGTRTVTAARLRGVPARGAGRAVIRGHNYSAWRSGYRVRHGGGWRTFVALSTLGAILVGSNEYYPYAYISAPEPYCEGLTEDGCELMWQQVETVEGDVVDQCVAYCPWQ
jgi:hypothetical protein